MRATRDTRLGGRGKKKQKSCRGGHTQGGKVERKTESNAGDDVPVSLLLPLSSFIARKLRSAHSRER